ncbi:MAG: thiosulfate/3-mercaptopyruvate sulfurtransferase [Pseudonocardiales bacterium]|jgi:thiosulfate/3-mercaptopyruvate sulfurtransferase|nr:thiosulfate/3-mercaptopyruvate sulfurtransferase [Pseudonocardiales bacterium]
MNGDGTTALVGVASLAQQLGSTRPPVLLDVRWVVGAPALVEDYLAAHIPGAQFVDLDTDLADPPGARGRHPLPDPDRLQATLRSFGVDDGSAVVVYDGDSSVAAARAWWVLRWAGLTDVGVLDGGFAAWTRAGGQVEAGRSVAERTGSITVRPGSLPSLEAQDVPELASAGRLIDVRAPQRFRGEVEPIDPVAGHIPGARNLPTADLVSASGAFLPPKILASRFASAGLAPQDPPVGVYCGSGVTAAQMMLAMHEAGIQAVLYPGSWSEWISDPTRGVATGPQ